MSLKDLLKAPLRVMATRENIVIIQLHPKNRVVTVSYKKQIKKGVFEGNTIKNMLKGGVDFRENAQEVMGAIAQLLEQLIQDN